MAVCQEKQPENICSFISSEFGFYPEEQLLKQTASLYVHSWSSRSPPLPEHHRREKFPIH